MPLIKCEECGKEISDKAPACPGCGAPMAVALGIKPSPIKYTAASSPPIEAKKDEARKAKRLDLSFALTVFFGPLGLLYASPLAATICAFLTLGAIVLLGLKAYFVCWLVCMLVAAMVTG